MNVVLDAVGDAAYTVAVVAAALFVILYSILAKPWRTASGLHIFSFMLVISLTLIHGMIRVYWPAYPGYLWGRAILYVALAAVIIWRVLILLRVQMTVPKDAPRQRVK
jgi:hypothetical protein